MDATFDIVPIILNKSVDDELGAVYSVLNDWNMFQCVILYYAIRFGKKEAQSKHKSMSTIK